MAEPVLQRVALDGETPVQYEAAARRSIIDGARQTEPRTSKPPSLW
jgi:hypothetical protein